MRQGELNVRCPKCGARCRANRTEPRFTRYYCTRKCGGSRKVRRAAD